MSKEELVRKYSEGWVGGMTPGDEERIVLPAMDEFAKQQSTEFLLDFIGKLKVTNPPDQELILLPATIDKRYELFLIYQSQINKS